MAFDNCTTASIAYKLGHSMSMIHDSRVIIETIFSHYNCTVVNYNCRLFLSLALGIGYADAWSSLVEGDEGSYLPKW